MKRRLAILLVMVLAIALVGANGCAVPVHYEEGSLVTRAAIVRSAAEVLPAEEPEEEAAEDEATADEAADDNAAEGEAAEDDAADDEAYALDAADFHLLGTAADGSYILFADGQFLKVEGDALADLIADIGSARVAKLPKPEDYEPLARNAKGDAVRALQEALQALGYLNGSVDGSYGGGCQRAVTAFQKDMGAEQTGAADELTQMLIASAQEETVSFTPYVDPAERYAAIAGKTTANLAAIAESGLRLEYDDIAGTGLISDNTVIEYDASGESDVDQYSFTVQLALVVRQNDDGEIAIDPALCLNCLCVRRPIMQEVILKSGDERFTVAISDLQNSLSGAKSVETATVLLDEGAVAMLANAADEGELKIRINGKYQSFDIDVDEAYLESIANVARAAQGL